MTANQKKSPHRLYAPASRGSAFRVFIILFFLLLFIRNGEIAIQQMRAGLLLCASHIIPSLFPFMVLSELLVNVSFEQLLQGRIGTWIGRKLGVSGSSLAAILLGSVCGFPVGAKTVVSLYDKGLISKSETERAMMLCNIPGPGFVIGTVGLSLFSDRRFGIFLYLSLLICTLLIGILYRTAIRESGSTSLPPIKPPISPRCLTDAISSATFSMLTVCAYVIFFSAVVGCLFYAVRALGVSSTFRGFLFSVFEISSGVHAAATVPTAAIRTALCGFSIGWSGLSVHFQIAALTSGRDISLRRYFISKTLQSLFCAATAWLYGKFFTTALPPSDQSAVALPTSGYRPLLSSLISLFFFICFLLLFRRTFKKLR